MQLISINISNILSFPYQEEFSQEKKIHFNLNKNGGVHIFIGPNGSGKTNFTNIITQILKVALTKDFIYKNNKENPQKSITENHRLLEHLEPHFSHKDKKSGVDIELHISEEDKENMIFLQREQKKINKLIKENSVIDYQIATCELEKIDNLQTLHIQFSIDTNNKTAKIINKQKSKSEEFALNYLIYQELFQIAIMIYNQTNKTEEKSRKELKSTVGTLNNTRNFYNIKRENTSEDLREKYICAKNYKDNISILGYALCIKKITNIINNNTQKNLKKDQEYVDDLLQESLFFNSLKTSIKKYLKLILRIKYENKNIKMIFIDETGQEQTIHSLSNGEQSLLIILLTIYGYDLKNGLLIIDEPELHFHPQMQKRLTKMLEKLNQNIGTQCLISTYSPIFIDEKNISNVYRFSKKNGETEIKIPDRNIGNNESSLIQILKFENAAKIFFADKIIMVEGEIDAYFFEFYLQYLHNLPERKDKIINYEIININGKGSYKKRSDFLKKFGIESFFIGDRDNTIDYGFINQQELNSYYKQSKAFYRNNKKNKNDTNNHYARLVNTVKNLYPNRYNTILENIELLYKKNVFILKKGDIETYLGIKTKGLEETIAFCHNFFSNRLENKTQKDHISELNKIIEIIFSQKND